MLRSDWLSYYYAICYSPLVAKIAGYENQNSGSRIATFYTGPVAQLVEQRFALQEVMTNTQGIKITEEKVLPL